MSGMERININDIDNYKNRLLGKNIYYGGKLVVQRNAVLNDDTIKRIKEVSKKSGNITSIFIFDKSKNASKIETIIMKETKDTINVFLNSILGMYSYGDIDDKNIIHNIIELFIAKIFNNEDYYINFLESIMTLNEPLYNHSIRTCIMSILLAIKAGLPHNLILDIGIGGLLHDIGLVKLYIEYPELADPNHIYTFEEYQLAKTHPILGYNEVEFNNVIPVESKKIILMHHIWDDYDKSYSEIQKTHISYPNHFHNKKLDKNSKDIGVRIVQMAGNYDKLLYQKGKYKYNTKERIDYIQNNLPHILGNTMIHLLSEFISPFSEGSEVILTDGREAKIIKHTNDTLNPIVELDGEEVDLRYFDDLQINLEVNKE